MQHIESTVRSDNQEHALMGNKLSSPDNVPSNEEPSDRHDPGAAPHSPMMPKHVEPQLPAALPDIAQSQKLRLELAQIGYLVQPPLIQQKILEVLEAETDEDVTPMLFGGQCNDEAGLRFAQAAATQDRLSAVASSYAQSVSVSMLGNEPPKMLTVSHLALSTATRSTVPPSRSSVCTASSPIPRQSFKGVNVLTPAAIAKRERRKRKRRERAQRRAAARLQAVQQVPGD